jgi:hypothetical protein
MKRETIKELGKLSFDVAKIYGYLDLHSWWSVV